MHCRSAEPRLYPRCGPVAPPPQHDGGGAAAAAAAAGAAPPRPPASAAGQVVPLIHRSPGTQFTNSKNHCFTILYIFYIFFQFFQFFSNFFPIFSVFLAKNYLMYVLYTYITIRYAKSALPFMGRIITLLWSLLSEVQRIDASLKEIPIFFLLWLFFKNVSIFSKWLLG